MLLATPRVSARLDRVHAFARKPESCAPNEITRNMRISATHIRLVFHGSVVLSRDGTQAAAL
jgi:hypothetical protein